MSTKEQIIQSLKWIGIEHDGDEYVQSKYIKEHVSIVNELLKKGKAYRCFCSLERLENLRNEQKLKGENPGYDKHCRKNGA